MTNKINILKMEKIKKFKRNVGKYALLQFLLILFFLPCIVNAEEYKNAIDTVFATSDSRMVINIEENDTIVELQVMAMGPLRAQSYSFNLAYNKSSLNLMLADLSDEVALVPQGQATGNIIQMQPVIANLGYSQEVMQHQELTNRDMRSVTLTVTYSKTDVGESKYIKPAAGELMHVFSVFLQKKNAGTALDMTSDLGFYYNNSLPMSVSMWTCLSSSLQAFRFPSGYQAHYYNNDTLFTYRSPSSVVTEAATAIAETSATLNGVSIRGTFNPSTTIINDGNSVTRNDARLDYDTIHTYGFIYGKDSLEILVDGITKKITIEGTEYDFPDATEIAAGTFTRDEMEFFIVSVANTDADKDLSYEANITGLLPGTTYYAWAFNWYAFHTSDTYLNVGEMIEFTTEGTCELPELPIVLAEQSFCDGATVADLIVFVDEYDVKWFSSLNEELELTDILVDGETYYAQVANDCDSVRAAVTVNIVQELVSPSVTTPQVFCPGSLVSDLRADGDSIVWYDAMTGGHIVDPSEILTDGFYYAALKINDCESAVRSMVKVIIEETILDAPEIESPQSFCDDATLADIATDGSNIVWYSASGALLPSTIKLANATTYYAAYVAGTCESAERTPVLVYTGMEGFIDAPAIASPQRFCEGASIQNIEVPNTQIIWYASAEGNTGISSNTLLGDNTVYYAAQRVGECESTERTPVRILLDNPQVPEAPSPQVFCGDGYTLADLEITGNGIVWYNAPENGSVMPITTPLTTEPTMYYAAQSAFECESARIGVLAYVNVRPEEPVVSGELIVCSDEETFDLTSVIEKEFGTTYTFYFDEGITIVEDPENVPIFYGDEINYYVRAIDTVTGCESESLGEIEVTISPLPEVSVTPAGAYTAVYDSVVLTISDDNTNTAADAKTITILDESIASIQLVDGELKVIGKARGNTEIVYTSVNENGCTTELIIPVQIEGLPTGILVGKDIYKCNLPGGGDTTLVQIAYVMGGVAPWTVTVSDDRGTFSQDTVINSIEEFPVNMTVILPENTSNVPEFTTYVISNVVDGLGSSKETHYGAVRIGINPTPVITDVANAEQVVCAGESTLPISFDGVSTIYRWSIDKNIGIENYSSGVIPSFVAQNDTDDAIDATITITPEYWYNTVVCIGESTTAFVRVTPTPKANFVAKITGLGMVEFTNRSSDIVVEWTWDFGDGTTSDEENPTHEYEASGVYVVTLTAATEDGCTAIFSREIKVSVSTDVFADFIVDNNTQCLSDNEFLFTDRSTVSTENHYVSAWLWNFGDDSTSTERNPSHKYEAAGTYIVTLTVTEMPGNSQYSIRYPVYVIDMPSIIDGEAPEAICAGEKLRVSTPEIAWNGNAPVSGQWLLDGKLFDPNITTLTHADNGKLLQYRIETTCGVVVSDGVAVSVYGTPEITLENSVVTTCGIEDFVELPYTVNNPTDIDLYYSISFNDDARRAGFKDVSLTLMAGDTLTIAVPTKLKGGYYGGVLSVQAESGCQNASTYAFDIYRAEPIKITQQPLSQALCGGGEFVLSVEAEGEQLAYQWYRNGELLSGETSTLYIGNGDDEAEYGEYHVEITGACESVTSGTAIVRKNTVTLLTKWTDVIFVSNKEELFVAYQWYKDEKPIAKEGQYQSYVEYGGLNGTYKVLVTYADGTTEMSCPYTINMTDTKRGDVVVYPNPIVKDEYFTIDVSQFINGDIENVKVEVFDVTGRQFVDMKMTSSKQKARIIGGAKGTYVLRLTTPQNEVIIKKIIVAQ